MPYIVLALPCYNEAENIIPLLNKCIEVKKLNGVNFDLKVVVINDCSKDNTRELVEGFIENNNSKLEVTLINHEENKGLTGGINTSINYFHKMYHSDNPPIACGLMDGDNSHSPHVLPSMVQKIMEDYDVVIASRFRPGSRVVGVSGFRQLLSLGLTCLFKLLRNLPGVRDYSCGYRLYSKRIVNKLNSEYGNTIVQEKSFASMVEILIKCHMQGAIMTEVPFMLRYDYKLGESKMPVVKTIKGNLKLLSTLRGHRA